MCDQCRELTQKEKKFKKSMEEIAFGICQEKANKN